MSTFQSQWSSIDCKGEASNFYNKSRKHVILLPAVNQCDKETIIYKMKGKIGENISYQCHTEKWVSFISESQALHKKV